MQQFIRDMASFATWPDVVCWLILLFLGVWKLFNLCNELSKWVEGKLK
jgi:hypothetical protein